MNVTTLLLPFDGSPAATRAVELLASYRAEPSALALHVLNVQAPPIKLWPEAMLDINLVEAALIETGCRTLKPAIERLAAPTERLRRALLETPLTNAHSVCLFCPTANQQQE